MISSYKNKFESDYRNSFNLDFICPDLTFSVCTSTDLKIWMHTSKNLLEYVPSNYYLIIVPDDEVKIFRAVTDKKINVIPETVYINDLRKSLNERNVPKNRIGWYLQQFIKLSVLKQARTNENYVIWDADTVPLKEIGFFERSGKVQFYIGSENHEPYFETIEKLLGFGKVASFSFIAQSFPCKGIWAKEFFDFIENRFPEGYETAIINNINFAEESGFSEYETLGSFILNRFQEQLIIKKNLWLRNGCGLIGGPDNLIRFPYKNFLNEFDHITFERWEEPFSLISNQNKDFINDFINLEKSVKPDFETYLDALFNSNSIRTVVQIGANDGIQNDPLRKYLISSGSYQAILVEPIPFYVDKLKALYSMRDDIKILKAAAGAKEEELELFFIPPELATKMNGDGPQNDWAHGQGSFNKDTIIHWIKENSFRGNDYISNIDLFINSIDSITLQVLKTEKILPCDRNGLLLIIDVQGFEVSVLNGIDWSNPPQWIVVEDDLDNTLDFIKFFYAKGFEWVAGDHDKVFARI